MKFRVLIFAFFATSTSLGQNKDDRQIETLLIDLLTINKNTCYKYVSKFKSDIAEDTSIARFRLYYAIENNNLRYQLFNDESSEALFFDGAKYMLLYHATKEYRLLSSKESRNVHWRQMVESLPVSNPQAFIKKLKEAKLNRKADVYEWWFENKRWKYNIKDRELSWDKIIFTPNGFQYEGGILSMMQAGSDKAEVNFINEDWEKIYAKFDNKKNQDDFSELKKAIGKKQFQFTFIDQNGHEISSKSLSGKFVLIDLFYQSCMPCIKSFPFLNELSDSIKFPMLQVLGVDPILSDTLNMKRFVNRYKLKYPIITGNSALKFWQQVKNNGYPVSLLLDRAGVLIRVFEGYDEKIVDKVIREIRK